MFPHAPEKPFWVCSHDSCSLQVCLCLDESGDNFHISFTWWMWKGSRGSWGYPARKKLLSCCEYPGSLCGAAVRAIAHSYGPVQCRSCEYQQPHKRAHGVGEEGLLKITDIISPSWRSVVVSFESRCLNPIKVKAQHCYLLLSGLDFVFKMIPVCWPWVLEPCNSLTESVGLAC